MKKFIIAAAIILTSGVTALSVTKKDDARKQAIETSIRKSDFESKGFAGGKSDLATIQ